MATTNAIYHDPTLGRTRTRRNSSRRSFASSSLSRSNSHLESPRAPCLKDGNAFAYDPAYLCTWYLPQELWAHLTTELQSSLAAVQHTGAAVMTGFTRLNEQTEKVDGLCLDSKIPEDDLFSHLTDLPPPRYRTISNASSVFSSVVSSPITPASPATQSGCTSPVALSISPSSQALSSLSPVTLGPSADLLEKRRPRERSFSTPLEPHNAYYATELSYLRTEALPRLRHLGRKVDTDWFEAKRSGNISAEDVNAFESWWAEKKTTIASLNEKCKRLASAHGVAATGMGWCAP
ncbi:hypothetical protein GQ44DRAFT_775454 [Phaeosphaeriaceae sp. PMI808]|nr:hypothetical protein GQ44DRAFT_775454 [Phaeosphaeriaceae sp. PMI808]